MQRDQDETWSSRFSQTALGEGDEDVSSRADEFMSDFEIRHGSALVFSHGVVIRYLRTSRLLHKPELTDQMNIENNQLCMLVTG